MKLARRWVKRTELFSLLLLVVSGISFQSHAQDVPFTQINVDSSFRSPFCKALGDIDGDGDLDLLAGGYDGTAGVLIWWETQTNGVWDRHIVASNPGLINFFMTSMDVGDVDNDGDLDIIIPTAPSKGEHVWWFENPRLSAGDPGDPRTDPWTKHAIGDARSHDCVVGDVNGDGKLDVVVTYRNVTLFLQNSPTSWTKKVIGAAWEGTALGDLDRDGDMDIIVAGKWFECPANPATEDWAPHTYDADANMASTADMWVCHTDDVNQDGRIDIMVVPGDTTGIGELRLYLAPLDPKNGSWTKVVVLDNMQMLHGIQTGDVDNDGDIDIVGAEMEQSSQNRVMVLHNEDGAGTAWRTQVVATGGSHWLKMGDIDDDGDLDMYGINHGNNGGNITVHVWRSDLDPLLPLDQWETHLVDASLGQKCIWIMAGDVNGDTHSDLIGGEWWWANPGTLGGSWTRHTLGTPLYGAAWTHDFDGDGDLDVFGTQGRGDSSSHSFAWAKNNGLGAFTISTDIGSGYPEIFSRALPWPISEAGPR